ncbi:MAG: hypothetical protein OXH68_19245 [Gammaproteobacteria bacterium]|nr:hypothetical protein [Gammaproteobacteria bacterium]
MPSPTTDGSSPSQPSASPSGGGGSSGRSGARPPLGGGSGQGGPGGFEPPSGGDDGSEPAGPDGGWEVSNEPGEPAARTGQDTGDGGSEGDGDSQIDALERALGELDGEILDERVTAVGSQRPPAASGPDTQGNDAPAPPRAEPDVSQPPIPLPPDRPDARDDDVVARQLREAAMAETDPELREQLWEEYRRYLSGL